ncbi:MAG: lysophospholipid acyltransferase family protein [Paracoccaceae bacterium]
MIQPWQSGDAPMEKPVTTTGWLLILIRGTCLFIVVIGGLVLLLLLRLVERPVWGLHRPWTPHITQTVCRAAFRILGIRYIVRGQLMPDKGAVVSNHVSWLDIFALNARKRVYFVSKSEVARWPLIGWLARATGTVFIRRNARDAKVQNHIFEARLNAGHRLLFFPEGTSTDGMRVLPFKSTLFAAFFARDLRDMLSIQPVTVIYHAPKGEDPRFYGWWADMDFGSHFLKVLATPRPGAVELVYHSPVRVRDFSDRKALASQCEAAVRSALPPNSSPR